MRLSDTALGLLVAAFGGALVFAALQLPGVRGQQFGAGFFPAIVGGLAVLAGFRQSPRAAGGGAGRRSSPPPGCAIPGR